MYDIPWPSTFLRYLSALRVFLVDVISITQANCAQPMTYYASLVVVLLGLKLALALLLVGPWLLGQLYRGSTSLSHWLRRRALYRHTVALEATMHSAGRRRASVVHAIQGSLTAAQHQIAAIDWVKVFKASFMLLFVAYPGIALKIMQLFHCVKIEGEWYLEQDMRLQCYTGDWTGYAIYAIACGLVYVVGLPAIVLVLLYRRRHKLFGDAGDPFVATTRAKFGFLYEVYGPNAW